MKTSRYAMRNYGIKIDFVQGLANEISWPIGCFAAFIDNALESYVC